MFWIAKCEGTYVTEDIPKGLRPPFHINHDKILPGFLGRGLSLPWQSDFDLCNTHWWPSARPDDVLSINAKVRQIIDEHTDQQSLPALLSAQPRSRWAEGLRDTPEDVTTSFFPGSTDMVRKWNELGFVAKIPDVATSSPIWAEVDRTMKRGLSS
jgi:hypothetical protein